MGRDVYGELGSLLRRLRSDRGLSLAEIEGATERVGRRIPRSRLSSLERGEAEIHLADAVTLGQVYGLTVLDLFDEALAVGPTHLSKVDASSDALRAEACRVFEQGSVLEAAWMFDEAARRAGEEGSEEQPRSWLFAAHAYDRAGALRLALRRVEAALDAARENTELQLRCMLKAAVLLARLGATGRTRVLLQAALSRDSREADSELSAYLHGCCAESLLQMGAPREALSHAVEALRIYRALGDIEAARAAALAARCALGCSEKPQAERLAKDALQLLGDSDQFQCRLYVLISAAETQIAVGRTTSTQALLKEAVELARSKSHVQSEAEALELLERWASSRGDRVDAQRWKRRRQRLILTGSAPRLLSGKEAR